MLPIHEQLAAMSAHHDLVVWSRAFGEDWQALYTACPRGDWLLALLTRLGAEPRTLVPAAARCAKLAASYLESAPEAWLGALTLAESFDGSALAYERLEAAHAALLASAQATDAVEDAVRDSVAAALGAAREPELAAHAGSCAVHAAVIAAGECAVESALRFTQERTAELVRQSMSASDFAQLAAR